MAQKERREQTFGSITGGPIDLGGDVQYTAEFPGIRDGDVPATVAISARVLHEAGLNPPKVNDLIIAEVNMLARSGAEVHPTGVTKATWFPNQ